MLARWLPVAAAAASRRVACRASKAGASRATWVHPLANARPRLVRAHSAGGWRISDDLSRGGGGGSNDDGPSRDRDRDGGRSAPSRGRGRPPARGYDSEFQRDEYDEGNRRPGRGGRGRGRDGGFRDDFRNKPRGGRGEGRGGRGRGTGRGGRSGRGGRGERNAFRDEYDTDSRGSNERSGGNSFYGARNNRDENAFDRDASDRPETPNTFHNSDPSKRNDTGQNDWDCGACGADNFARRSSCFRCGAAKSDASKSARGPIERMQRMDARDDRFDERPERRFVIDREKGRGDRGGRGDRAMGRDQGRGDNWDVGRHESSTQSSDSPRKPLPPGCSRFYVTCHPGLESAVADELMSHPINAIDVTPGASGVYFVGTVKTGILANVWLRSAIRVLCELRHGWLDSTRPGGEAVYDFVRHAVPWHEVVPEQTKSTFSFESRVWSCTDVTSTRLAVTRAKDAVCDALVDVNGWRPPPPANGHSSADVPLFLSLYRDEATLYRDMSGESLHRRGYRDAAIHRAALNEAAAAGILHIAGWNKACQKSRAMGPKKHKLPVLVDPMCGSGTLLVEAALVAGMVAPGLVRMDAAERRNSRSNYSGDEYVDDGSGFQKVVETAYAFERWPDFDQGLLHEVLSEAEVVGSEARKQGSKPVLIGNDAHGGALSLARRAAVAAGVDNLITFTQGDCADITHPALDEARVLEQERFEGNNNTSENHNEYEHSDKYGEGFVNLDDL
ncbi:hypothetical protein N9L76_08305, partial [bacterium]|nr:hypothetical protein [bacterium]